MKRPTDNESEGNELADINGIKKVFRSILLCFLIALILTANFSIFFGIAVVHGPSMEPRLQDGDIVLYWKSPNEYQRGDIVFVHRDDIDGKTVLVKRICALPGEFIEINSHDGTIVVNGEVLVEPYVYKSTYGRELTYVEQLNDNEYFIMGDYREVSIDSRDYGAININQIDGKALIVIRF